MVLQLLHVYQKVKVINSGAVHGFPPHNQLLAVLYVYIHCVIALCVVQTLLVMSDNLIMYMENVHVYV